MKEYTAIVWIGDQPGTRVTLQAEDAADAERQLREEFGEDAVWTVHNEGDAQRPR
jgi:hypothetical protein